MARIWRQIAKGGRVKMRDTPWNHMPDGLYPALLPKWMPPKTKAEILKEKRKKAKK
jgi:hypothetical protein